MSCPFEEERMKTSKLLVLAMTLSFATAYAEAQEQVLNSAPINVDGYLAEDKPVTDGELEQIRSELNKQKMGTQLNKEKAKDLGKLTKQTEKLLDSQDEYIDSKIESTQAIKEFNSKYEDNQKKLNCIMEESNSPDCEKFKKFYRKDRAENESVEQQVQVQQAAPVVSTAEVAPTLNTGAAFEKIKLLIGAGGTSYNGENEELEAELSTNLRLESNITSRFSIGIGFNYSQLKTNDFANNMLYMNSNPYQNNFGGGREIQFKTMGIDLYGKFFITNNERFRPYLGAGLGYNMASMKYAENNEFFDPYYQSTYGNENFKTNYASGTLMAGAEIMITQGFGVNLEASYATGLGDGFSSKSAKNSTSSLDQARLNDLGEEIIGSNMLSVFAGAVINF